MKLSEVHFILLVSFIMVEIFGILLLTLSRLIKYGYRKFAKLEMSEVALQCDNIHDFMFGVYSLSIFIGCILMVAPLLVTVIVAMIIVFGAIIGLTLIKMGITF